MYRMFATVALVFAATQAQAKVDAAQAERLGRDLTPLGAEQAANADGSIPAWTGGVTPPPGYQPGMHHPDPYAQDREVYRVDVSNLAQYQHQLPAGLADLLTRHADYHLRVFPSRRSVSNPQRIYRATRENATRAELIANGNGIRGAAAGIPFPIPQEGMEVIWNHILHYKGENTHFINNQAVVINGNSNLIKRDRAIYYVYNREGMTTAELDNTLPLLAYDSVQPDTSDLATADVVDSFNGAPDRYDWTLVGKQEMLVPYNSYAVHQKGISYDQIVLPRTLNPELLRYELHRVWIVEAALRTGYSHPYAARRFYIDEDSWQILAVDLRDKDGELIGLQESHPINYYDVPMFGSTLETLYHLQDNNYFVDGLDNNEPMYDFDANLTPRDFSPQALRRSGN